MAKLSTILCILACGFALACVEAEVSQTKRQPSTSSHATDDTHSASEDTDGTETHTADTTETGNHTDDTTIPTETENPDTNSSTDSSCTLNSEQSFSSSQLPKGWSITDGANDGYTWQWSGSGNNIGTGSGTGHYFIDATNIGSANLEELFTTEEFDRGGCASVRLYFAHRFDRTSDQGRVSVQVDGGTWKSIRTFYADDSGSEDIDLTNALGGGKKFRVQFEYEGGAGPQYWRVDDVRVAGQSAK